MPATDLQEAPSHRRDRLTALAVVLLWSFFYYPAVAAPWIHGIDTVRRLTHLDRTVVVSLGNPWLPALQLVLRGVHAVTDSPAAYKLAVCLIALAGIWFFFLTVSRLLGYRCAVLSSLYFFMHAQWSWMATMPYMEPLLLFSLSAAAYCSLRGRARLAGAFFILATFSRPEILIGLPFVLGFHALYYRDFRRTLRLGLLYLPILAYYGGLKLWLPEFESPGALNWAASLELIERATRNFRISPAYQFLAVLALLGVLRMILGMGLPPKLRRGLLLLLVFYLLFFIAFIVFVPAAHAISPSSRHSVLTVLPAFVLAAIFLDGLYAWKPGAMGPVLLVIISVALTYRYSQLRFNPSDGYLNTQHILRRLGPPGHTREALRACKLDSAGLTQPDIYEFHRWAVYLHLRFAGWNVIEVDCPLNHPLRSEDAPLLRIFDLKGVSPAYRQQLTVTCRYYSKIRYYGRTIATACL